MSGPYITVAEAPDRYYAKKETRKMNFLQRWFDRKCREAWERARSTPATPVSLSMIKTDHPTLNADGMTICVYGATGGHILEFRRYDRHKDRNDNKMYVIPVEQNFTESFSKIVSMEMLR